MDGDHAPTRREAEREDYRLSSLILGIVQSTPFQMRRAAAEMETRRQ
jgi:hypothetical protein